MLAMEPPPPIHAHATCYALQGVMADGTRVRPHSAASNTLRLGTKVRLVGPSFYGIRNFVIRDTGGLLGDGRLDLWNKSHDRCVSWGYRRITFRVVGHV